MLSLKSGEMGALLGCPLGIAAVPLRRLSQEAMLFAGEVVDLLRVVATLSKPIVSNESVRCLMPSGISIVKLLLVLALLHVLQSLRFCNPC